MADDVTTRPADGNFFSREERYAGVVSYSVEGNSLGISAVPGTEDAFFIRMSIHPRPEKGPEMGNYYDDYVWGGIVDSMSLLQNGEAPFDLKTTQSLYGSVVMGISQAMGMEYSYETAIRPICLTPK